MGHPAAIERKASGDKADSRLIAAAGRFLSVLTGDSRQVLRALPDMSVNCCITSPPYWGLRDYGLPPLLWDGATDCRHVWIEQVQAAGNAMDHYSATHVPTDAAEHMCALR